MTDIKREVIYSVTNFLYFDDKYLMLKRNKNAKVDANRLNGIGGKLEIGENYLDAAIRETKEETGYEVSLNDIQFVGIIKLHGGYPQDWIMSFFKIKVPTLEIPHGNHVKEGELIWMDKDKVLTSEHELVDDLHYCFKEIIKNEGIFFITEEVGEDEKIKEISMSILPNKR
ncbi:MAG TPA: NUDIX domain-containing protein [Patescibacteria group bacterium]